MNLYTHYNVHSVFTYVALYYMYSILYNVCVFKDLADALTGNIVKQSSMSPVSSV